MTAIGGSIESVTLSGREFPVAADAEASRKIGGFENEMLANGNGTSRMIKTRGNWLLEGVALEIDDSRQDHEYLQALADRNGYFDLSVTYASGITYQASGQVQGAILMGSQTATAPLSFSGPGEMTQQT